MHRCFEIEDIVALIVDQYCVQGYGIYVPCKQRTTIAALAATSRIFYEPSMNALCRVITSDHLFYICGAQKSSESGGLATEATAVGGALVVRHFWISMLIDALSYQYPVFCRSSRLRSRARRSPVDGSFF